MTAATEGAQTPTTEEGTETPKRKAKERRAVVVSAKMQNTVIVAVERRVKHKKYLKYMTVRKRFAAHDTIGCVEGDIVLIRETRPLSKTKRWRVSRKLEKHQ